MYPRGRDRGRGDVVGSVIRAPAPWLALCVALVVASACATSADRLVAREAMERDARRIARRLRLAHPAVGRTASAGALDATLAGILADLPDTATALAFARRVRPLLDALRGGHVGLYPRGRRWRSVGSRPDAAAFPLSPRRLTDGRIVAARLAPGIDSALLGEEIVAIDGEPVAALLAEAEALGGGSDGPNLTGAAERAARRLPAHLAWRDGARDTFHVELRPGGDPGADPYAATLPAYRPADHPRARERDRARRRRWRPLGYGFDTARRVAVIDVNSFSGYDPLNLRWPVATRRAFRRARREGAAALVLDLRGNGGGRSANVATLLRQVVREPTPLYGAWSMPRSGWRGASLANKVLLAPSAALARGDSARFGRWMRHRVRPRRRGGFDGPVVALVDGGTFSAAAVTAAVLKSSGRATLVGQEAGGNYHETYAGLFTTVPLRGAGLRLRLPHLLIPVAVDPRVQGFGVSLQPDVAWPVTREAVLSGVDEVLLRGLEEAGAASRRPPDRRD